MLCVQFICIDYLKTEQDRSAWSGERKGHEGLAWDGARPAAVTFWRSQAIKKKHTGSVTGVPHTQGDWMAHLSGVAWLETNTYTHTYIRPQTHTHTLSAVITVVMGDKDEMVLELITLCTLLQLIHQSSAHADGNEPYLWVRMLHTHLSWAKRGALKQRQTVSGVSKRAGADTKAHYTNLDQYLDQVMQQI